MTPSGIVNGTLTTVPLRPASEVIGLVSVVGVSGVTIVVLPSALPSPVGATADTAGCCWAVAALDSSLTILAVSALTSSGRHIPLPRLPVVSVASGVMPDLVGTSVWEVTSFEVVCSVGSCSEWVNGTYEVTRGVVPSTGFGTGGSVTGPSGVVIMPRSLVVTPVAGVSTTHVAWTFGVGCL